MTSSWRGLALCTALVLCLALAWVLGGGRDPALAPPQVLALVPGEVRELRLATQGREIQQGGAGIKDDIKDDAKDDALRLRRRGGGWESEQGLPVRAGAVEDLLGVVAAARWHRRAEAKRAGAITHVVTIDGTAIGLGEALGAQRWILVRGQALLVDGWVARVLAVEPASLLDRSVLPGAARSPVIEVHGRAAPWRTAELVVQGEMLVSPARHRLDPQEVRRLREALAGLELLPSSGARDRDGEGDRDADLDPERWSIRIAQGPGGEATLTGEGRCLVDDDAEAVASSLLGRGCVARAQLVALGQQLDRVATAAAEARPLAADAADIVEWQLDAPLGGSLRMWRDGGRWQAQRGGEAQPFAVEDPAVERLLSLWTSPWQVVRREAAPPASSGSRTASLTAQRRDGARISLRLGSAPARPLLATRDGEALSLAAPPELLAALGGSLSSLTLAALTAQILPLGLWQLEPTAVLRLRLNGRTLGRGAVVGEWIDEGSGQLLPAASAAAVEELVASLATLRARSRLPHGARAVHHLAVWSAADPSRRSAAAAGAAGDPYAQPSHRVELVVRGGECLGRGDGAEARFEAVLCEQVGALAALLR